jgi:hypothetical protein
MLTEFISGYGWVAGFCELDFKYFGPTKNRKILDQLAEY